MKKRFFITLLVLLLVVAIIAGIKTLQIKTLIQATDAFVSPPVTVTTSVVEQQQWETTIQASGSLKAVNGVMVSPETAGKIIRIAFKSGATVKQGELLVQLDVSTEKAQLREAEASKRLARLNLKRLKNLINSKAVSRSEVDDADAAFQEASARVESIRSQVAKKTIKAPFAGRLGVSRINIGQDLSVGEAIVSLQSLNPVYVDFYLPQQQVVQIKPGYVIRVQSDLLGDAIIEGRINAIDPQADSRTRNVLVQATIENTEDEKLYPGMFVNVSVVLPEIQNILAIPSTAVLYAPYGDSVFVIEKPDDKDTPSTARQQFIRSGKARGDYISVLTGLDAGQEIVNAGGFALSNGQAVIIDNTHSLNYQLNPEPADN